jgi:predicted Rossmann fold nucleotide-binding protein DprA/Smf involved in DNA uptake
MTQASDRAVVLALCARDLSSPAKPFTAAETWRLLKQLSDRGMRPADLGSVGGVADEDRVAERLRTLDHVEPLIERYAEQGIWVLTPFDDEFPARLATRLGTGAPVLLYGAGHADLLAADGVGVVGSRDLDDEGVAVSEMLGRAIAEAGVTLVSGGARGADRVAMSAAAARGGAVVAALAHPLEREVADPEARRLMGEERLCLLTPFKPSAGFRPANAMARNRLIYGLTRCTAVVDSSDGRGGTWAGATEALRRGFGPVAVWSGPGAGDGNGRLIQLGAQPFATTEGLLGISREGFERARRRVDQLTMRV